LCFINASFTLQVERDPELEINSAIASELSALYGVAVQRISLSDTSRETIPTKAVVVVTAEILKPLLSIISDGEMANVKAITDNASTIVWVTGGDLLNGRQPDFALVSGLSRAIMLEQPSLKFFTYDIDSPAAQPMASAKRIAAVLSQSNDDSDRDFEFIESAGVVHICRFTPEESYNRTFRQKQNSEGSLMPLQNGKATQLHIGRVGQFDTVCFVPSPAQPLGQISVQVDVKSFGLNAKVSTRV
jgi:hypothetical protein